jgi:hypothetical protein
MEAQKKITHDLNKSQAHAAGRDARLKNRERIHPVNCDGGDIEEQWYVGYDQVAQAIDIKNKVEKPKQEFYVSQSGTPESINYLPEKRMMI